MAGAGIKQGDGVAPVFGILAGGAGGGQHGPGGVLWQGAVMADADAQDVVAKRGDGEGEPARAHLDPGRQRRDQGL